LHYLWLAVGWLAWKSQVPEGRIPCEYREHNGDVRNPVWTSTESDTFQHVLGLG